MSNRDRLNRRDPLARGPRLVPGLFRYLLRGLVLLVGLALLVAAALTGWLPGPGGIPLALLGLAVLSTQFEWAQRLRDWGMSWLKRAGTAVKDRARGRSSDQA